ncbi:MAG: LysE family translocator, partial [Spirochaetes bacterium]|nr:LysE family translocator [Spirochaetota bacterium]
YLLYLSWLSFRASASPVRMEEESRPSKWRLYRRGIFMNVTNPKVSIFFLAFLPQFTSPSRGSLTLQLVMLGAIFIAVTIVVFGMISQLSGMIGRWINRSERGQVILHRVAGTVFASLALKLVFTRQ